MGIKHVKGILLYGPPGTGKTLMARQIGKLLNGKDPKVWIFLNKHGYKFVIYLTICAKVVVSFSFFKYLKDILLYMNVRLNLGWGSFLFASVSRSELSTFQVVSVLLL